MMEELQRLEQHTRRERENTHRERGKKKIEPSLRNKVQSTTKLNQLICKDKDRISR